MCAANLLSQRTRLVEPPAPLLLFSSPCLCPCLRLAFALAFALAVALAVALALAFLVVIPAGNLLLPLPLPLLLPLPLPLLLLFWLSFPQGICLFSRSQQTPERPTGAQPIHVATQGRRSSMQRLSSAWSVENISNAMISKQIKTSPKWRGISPDLSYCFQQALSAPLPRSQTPSASCPTLAVALAFACVFVSLVVIPPGNLLLAHNLYRCI